MFCGKCGTQLLDNAKFCSKCGQPIEQNIKTIPKRSKKHTLNVHNIITKLSKRLKKRQIIGVVAIAAIVVAVAVLLFSKGGTDAESTAIVAKVSEDGTAYIPLYDGTSIVINEEVDTAVLTEDRKHIIVLLEDGTLYVTNKELSEKSVITDDCINIYSVRNDGFFYYKWGSTYYYRVRFINGEYLSIPIDDMISVAPNNTTVLYAEDDEIYTMKNSAAEGTKIDTYDNNTSIYGGKISDDGQLAFWTIRKDDITTAVLKDGDNITTLGEVGSNTYASFSKDQKTIFITDSDSEKMWIKTVGKDPVTVKLGASPESTIIYTENGMVDDEKSSDIKGVYISTEAGTGTNLYYISMNGNRERVMSEVCDYAIANKKIFYTDLDDTLYCADLQGSDIRNETKIAKDVVLFEVTDNGKYIYYIKDYSKGGVADLYCYKVGDKEPVKVATEVSSYYRDSGSIYKMLRTTYSADGATVFFYKDVEEEKKEEKIISTYHYYYYYHGTLMKWNYGDDSAEKISNDVMLGSVSSGLASGEVKPASFMYKKYNNIDRDGNILADWMYFNGKKSTSVAADIIY